MRFDLTLYLVSDSTGLSEDEFLRRLEQALRGGVTLLQLREKNRTTLEYYELARKVKKLTDAYGVPLMIEYLTFHSIEPSIPKGTAKTVAACASSPVRLSLIHI